MNKRAPYGGWICRQLAAALLSLLFLITGPAFALTLGAQRDAITLGSHYSFLEDPAATLTYEEVSGRSADRFQPLRLGKEPNFGYSRSAYWLRIPLTRTQEQPHGWLLEIPFPTLDEVDVYLRSARDGALVANYRAGDRQRFSARPVVDVHFVFPLPLTTGEDYELYVRVRSEGSLTVSAFLWPQDVYQAHSRTRYMLASIYLGVLAGLLAYHLLLFLSLRDYVYLLYVLFTAALLVAQGSWDGFAYQYLWPGAPAWANAAVLVGFNATGLFGALFSRSFFDTRERAPRLDAAILACAAAFAGLITSVTQVPYHVLALLSSLALVIFSLIAVLSGAVCLRRGFGSARYFLLAWNLLLAGAALLWARNADLVPTNVFTLHGTQLGSMLAVLLLSFALAERISAVRGEKEAAEAANRAKDEFLATVSHEIRTPLTVLLGNVGLLLGSGLQPQQSMLARSAKRSGEQLLSLLNDLIDLSRIASGQLHLEERPFEAGALVHEVVELMEVPARDKGLSIKVRLGFPRIYLLSDPGRIRQVLLNLVFNAIKFTDRGEIRIEATLIENAAGRATIRFAINDTGSGIKPADQERLFRPFSQVGSDHARRGSGLGLAISRRLVEAMGGTIRVFSRPGQGSRFWFDLDLIIVSEADAAGEDRQALMPAPTLRLLLVEDVYESREVLTAQLQQAGHRVTAVDSGQAALAAVTHRAFDAVLMDLQMPDMDGYATVQRLRASPAGRGLPVFALTANVSTRARAACMEAGMQGVVAKPLRMDELNATLLAFFGTDVPRTESPAHGSNGARALLDEAMLAERLSDLGAEATAKIMRAFFAVADRRAAAVLQAQQNADGQALARAAHVLRGSAGAVGLTALLELTGAIEEAAPRSSADAAALAGRLPDTLRSSVAALAAWCTAHGIEAGTSPVA